MVEKKGVLRLPERSGLGDPDFLRANLTVGEPKHAAPTRNLLETAAPDEFVALPVSATSSMSTVESVHDQKHSFLEVKVRSAIKSLKTFRVDPFLGLSVAFNTDSIQVRKKPTSILFFSPEAGGVIAKINLGTTEYQVLKYKKFEKTHSIAIFIEPEDLDSDSDFETLKGD